MDQGAIVASVGSDNKPGPEEEVEIAESGDVTQDEKEKNKFYN